MRRIGFVLAVLAAPAAVIAQGNEVAAGLATGDVLAVEAARRKLVTGAADDVPVDVARALLRSADPFRRVAAASVLLHHGLLPDAVAAWARDEEDPRALEPVVDQLPVDVLAAIVATEPRAVGESAEELPLDHDRALRVRARALGGLMDAGAMDVATWRLALASPHPGFARAAADRLVEEAWPFPTELLAGLSRSSRRTVLEALADRPRPEATAWAAGLIAGGTELDRAERLLALLAADPEAWPRELVRELPVEFAAEDLEVRGLAVRACGLLSTEQAERLVAEVHRRAVGGASLAELLPALQRIGPRGERHLLGLARELSDADRGAIVEWLAGRGSAVVDEIVGDALDDRYPLDAALLRRAGGLLSEHGRVGRVRAILVAEDAEPQLRVAAFGALVDRGTLEEGMLDFALDPDGDPRSRVRQLLSMPLDALPADAWQRLLAEAPHDVVREVMGRMAEVPVLAGVEGTLAELAATGVGLADTAAHVCLVAGRTPLARTVWKDLTDERRQHLAMSLRHRSDDWVLEALRATPYPDGTFEVPFARLSAGDRDVLEEILADPAAWPSRWLRRAEEAAEKLLRPEDVPVIAMALRRPDLDASQRKELLDWIARRPDLGAADVLRQCYAEDVDEDVRYAALRGLLRIPETARPFRARVSAAIADGLDPGQRDLAFEILGALQPPIDADALELVARLALVAPLAHPDHELRTALRQDPVSDVALLNAVWQVAGRRPPDGLEEAFDAAAAEASRHPNAWAASRHRLGRFLALLAREDETRRASGAIAKAVLAAPDLDDAFVGPACVVLAERAEDAGDWARAAELWGRAARGCLRTPPEPLLLRPFIGDVWRAEGRLPAAFLAARPHVCAARAALAADDSATARERLDAARILGQGDRQTEDEVRRLGSEIPR